MAVLESVVTYSDMLDYITALTDGGARTKDLRMHKEAILGAYKDVAMNNEWAYYMTEGRINLSSSYNTGTVVYDHTGGSSERILTLSGGTWPSWIQYGRVKIGDSTYPVDTKVSGTVVTLREDNNPGADVASSSYTSYRSAYALPSDMWRLYDVAVEKSNWLTYYVSPTEWQQRESYMSSGGQTWAWTIMKDPDNYGRWSLFVDPYPTTDEPLIFIYRRKPRDLRWSGTEAAARASSSQDISATAGASTITTDSALPQSMVGSIIRLSETATHPTGLAGNNPYFEQHKITKIASTTVTIQDPITNTVNYSNDYFIVSDPIDMSDNMIEALKTEIEYRLARFSNDTRDVVTARKIADYQLRRALEAESRINTRGGASMRSRYSYLFTNLDGAITTSS